jgi:uncharacterized protein
MRTATKVRRCYDPQHGHVISRLFGKVGVQVDCLGHRHTAGSGLPANPCLAFCASDLTKRATMQAPADAAARRARKPVVTYRVDQLPKVDLPLRQSAMEGARLVETVLVPPRDGRAVHVPAGHILRISSVEGPQVGDLNLWNAHDLTERFFSGKTRALHATHVTTGHHLWSNLPSLRPMATIIADSLCWYGFDADGAGVHDVIGTRCDPYTNHLLNGVNYHHCCHSNLARALADVSGLPVREAELLVHDVLNVFMCTGFTHDTHRYFMKASPVRPGDHIDFFAEIDLIAGLSACPGGDCGADHSSDAQACYPLQIEVFAPAASALDGWHPATANGYDRSHGR